jgi:hypothetical protein
VLNKLIWYLKDQIVVATTNLINHQAADQVVLTVQKEHHPHHHAPDQQALRRTDLTASAPQKVTATINHPKKDHIPHGAASLMQAKAMANIKAVLPVAKRNHFRHETSPIPAAHLITTAHRAKKDLILHRAVNPIQAE